MPTAHLQIIKIPKLQTTCLRKVGDVLVQQNVQEVILKFLVLVTFLENTEKMQ